MHFPAVCGHSKCFKLFYTHSYIIIIIIDSSVNHAKFNSQLVGNG